MFQETLLESSPATRQRSRWSMATAFTLQMIIASVLVIVPLLSTGIIPLSARVVDFTPIYTPIASTPPPSNTGNSSGVSVPQHATVVPVYNTHSLLGPFRTLPPGPSGPTGEIPNVPSCTGNCTGPAIPMPYGHVLPVPEPEEKKQRIKVSHLSEGMLLNKVVPVYPRMAIPTGIQGDVKLHAIIGKDGAIEALTVMSGHPMLTGAALDAVSQWKYRPYLLNGDPVEVETYITVTFTRER